MAAEADASIGVLFRGVLEDVRALVREEVALARAEIRQELGKASKAAVGFAVAGAALLLAAMCIVIALALGVAALFTWPAWAGFALTGVLLAAGGAVAYTAGRRAVTLVQPLPRTVHTLKENFR